MKKNLNLAFLLLLISLSTKAQDTSLYQGLSDISLRSGTVLKHITLWTIDSVRVEYVENGNLSEILTVDVLKIGTLDYEITFDEQNRVVKKVYDLIILYSGDTLRGFISRIVNDRFLEYYPASGKYKRDAEYKSYVRAVKAQDKVQEKVLTQKDTFIETQNEVGEDFFINQKGHYLNKDLIITKNGDSIWCTILKDDKTEIDYLVKKFGNDSRSIISKISVKKYFNNTYNSKFKKYDALNSANYQSSYPDLPLHNFDLIYTTSGDSIWCNIIKVGDSEIYYHISMLGIDPKIRISKNLVKDYINNDKNGRREE